MTAPKSDTIKVGPFRVAPHVRNGGLTGRWLIDLPAHVSPSGKRHRTFLETKTAAIAEAKRLLRDLQLDGAIRGYGPKLSGVSFSAVAQRWTEMQIDRVATNKKREISLRTHAFRLKSLLLALAPMDVANIASADIVTYQKSRLAAGRAPATVNSETRLLRQVLTWAADHDLVARVPKIEPIPEPRKRLSVPTTDEVLAVIEALPPRLALLVRFLAETGCRKGEAFALEWADIDEIDRLVMIRRKEGWTPKTAHSIRDIPLGPSLLVALMEARGEAKRFADEHGTEINPLVFPGRGGGRMWDFKKALATAIQKAGIARNDAAMHITPHMLRKANATWLKMRGIDDSLLQPRFGHAPGSRVTAHNYVHLPTAAMRGTVIDLERERQKANKRRLKGSKPAPEMATTGNAPIKKGPF
jgi:integrase